MQTWIKRIGAWAAIVLAATATLWFSVLGPRYEALYLSRLDSWVNKGGDAATVQRDVVENCGKLVMVTASPLEAFGFLTTDRATWDFHVDACVKLTVNRKWKQPEFEKPETVALICDGDVAIFRTLCKRSGLRQ